MRVRAVFGLRGKDVTPVALASQALWLDREKHCTLDDLAEAVEEAGAKTAKVRERPRRMWWFLGWVRLLRDRRARRRAEKDALEAEHRALEEKRRDEFRTGFLPRADSLMPIKTLLRDALMIATKGAWAAQEGSG